MRNALGFGLLFLVACSSVVVTPETTSSSSSSGSGGAAGGMAVSSSSSSASSTGGPDEPKGVCSAAPSAGNTPYAAAWAKGMANLSTDLVAPAADGGVLLGGWHTGPVDFGAGLSLPDGAGRFLLQYGPAGEPLSLDTLPDDIAQVIAGPEGSLWTTAPADVGSKVVISKRTPHGVPLWGVPVPVPEVRIAAGADGGLIVAGRFSGQLVYGGVSLSTKNPSDSDLFVLALDAVGSLRWIARAGAALPPPPSDGYLLLHALDVAAAPDGGAVVAAATTLGAKDAPEKHGLLVLRLDGNGKVAWTNADPLVDHAPDTTVTVDASGRVFLVGATGPGAEVHLGGCTFHGGGIVVSAFEADGKPRWGTIFHGDLGVTHPLLDPAGNLVLTGEVMGDIDFGGGVLHGPPNQFRIMLARLSPDGAHLASQSFGGGPLMDAGLPLQESRTEAAALDANGQLMMTGYYTGGLDFGTGALPFVPVMEGPYVTDAWVVKLGP
ncbi:MAG: hypothetical protein QM820_58975 [Minicystis sp.]